MPSNPPYNDDFGGQKVNLQTGKPRFPAPTPDAGEPCPNAGKQPCGGYKETPKCMPDAGEQEAQQHIPDSADKDFKAWREQYWPSDCAGSAYPAWRSARYRLVAAPQVTVPQEAQPSHENGAVRLSLSLYDPVHLAMLAEMLGIFRKHGFSYAAQAAVPESQELGLACSHCSAGLVRHARYCAFCGTATPEGIAFAAQVALESQAQPTAQELPPLDEQYWGEVSQDVIERNPELRCRERQLRAALAQIALEQYKCPTAHELAGMSNEEFRPAALAALDAADAKLAKAIIAADCGGWPAIIDGVHIKCSGCAANPLPHEIFGSCMTDEHGAHVCEPCQLRIAEAETESLRTALDTAKKELAERDDHIRLSYNALGEASRNLFLFDHIYKLRARIAQLEAQC